MSDRSGNGTVRLDDAALSIPMRWRKPRRIFVNSMSDLFHPSVPFEFIDRAFAVMALCPRHTFQVLTKRTERMAEYICSRSDGMSIRLGVAARELVGRSKLSVWGAGRVEEAVDFFNDHEGVLPNVMLGTSVENREQSLRREEPMRAIARACWFTWVSFEPLLENIDWSRWVAPSFHSRPVGVNDGITTQYYPCRWGVIGGESGPWSKVRPLDVRAARDGVAAFKAAGLPVFVKQMGKWIAGDDKGFACPSRWLLRDDRGEGVFIPPIIGPNIRRRPDNAVAFGVGDPKGGKMAEWPEDLRVREMPRMAEVLA